LAGAVGGFSAAQAQSEDFKIEQVEGLILVQDAEGFAPAAVGAALHTDQQILVKPHSAMVLIGTETSCFVHITTPGLYQLGADIPCEAGQVTSLETSLAILPANGGGYSSAEVGSGSLEPLLVGGGFAAAVAGVATWQMLKTKSVSQP
jgi:hypothetical protein